MVDIKIFELFVTGKQCLKITIKTFKDKLIKKKYTEKILALQIFIFLVSYKLST